MIIFDKVNKIIKKKFHIISDLSFEVEKGETLVLLGKSGCGKTTTLKMINRLIDVTSGNIYVNEEDVRTIDPIILRRNIGYAIQNVGLFNHMTVAENISIVPKLLKWDFEKIDKRVDELLELLGFIKPKEIKKRYPRHLSGGQKQRIGVARALAADPPIILMDEPFGALDPITREQVQNEFIELKSEINKTVVFVTHDVFEAVKLGDRIAVIDKGQIIQIATPSKLVEHPKNEFVDQFLGQHRFQLALMTKSIRKIFTPYEEKVDVSKISKKDILSIRSLLFDALDIFESTKKDKLPVFDKKKFVGYLFKSQMKKIIDELIK